MIARIRPFAFLIGRVVLGAVFIAHGWEKWNTNGIEATASGFESMGIPAPQPAAYFAATVELGGGVLLILGALLPLAGVLLAANMLGALYYVHLEAGLWVGEGGYEFVLSLAAFALAVGFSGGGVLAVDRLFDKKVAPAQDAPAEPLADTA